jgi:hypothetical protein
MCSGKQRMQHAQNHWRLRAVVMHVQLFRVHADLPYAALLTRQSDHFAAACTSVEDSPPGPPAAHCIVYAARRSLRAWARIVSHFPPLLKVRLPPGPALPVRPQVPNPTHYA